jgi:3-hydroxyisobutyrate dehydrogenase-like beta-hydroxyacid dehydrogenase
MSIKTVGILSPGDMGHAVGRLIGSHGLRVLTCLQGRSARTCSLAERAGIADVPTYQALVSEADILLSILVPAQAKAAAGRVAQAISETKAEIVYADCNAIAPQTTRQIDELITQAGGHYVDASIIGGPPRKPGTTRFYASGPNAGAMAELSQFGLNVVVLGDEIGLASAIKMCYAALTKGLTALCTELLTASEVLGVSQALKNEFQGSQAALYERMERGLPFMPGKSRRWVGEMEEISRTFEHIGLTPKILAGAADMYRLVGATHLADRNPEDPEPPPSLADTLKILADFLSVTQPGPNKTGA